MSGNISAGAQNPIVLDGRTVFGLPDTGAEYRSAVGWLGYAVGSDGTLWSCYRKGPGSPVTNTFHRLNEHVDRFNYRRVVLSQRGVRKTIPVHILVLETFVGPRPAGMIARHFPDPNKANCAANNLVWGTYQQNCEDRDRHGNTARGEKNYMARITEIDVRTIRAATGFGCVAALSRQFNLSVTSIIQIRKRRTWRHVL